MSVKMDRNEQLVKAIIKNTQNYVYSELNKYAAYLREAHNQIQNTINMHFLHIAKQQQADKLTISQLQYEIIELKQNNSFLTNQHILQSAQQQQTLKTNERILKENAQKEQRVRSLAQQVENIKDKLKNFQDSSQAIDLNVERYSRQIVDFDQGEEYPFHFNQIQGLQTINEVSEHDLSLTMSVQSLQSELIEENPKASSAKDKNFSQQGLGIENYQIQNYQDALNFLKSYNKGNTKVKKDVEMPITLQAKDCNKAVGQKSNQTINRIKRMRKIQDKNNQTNNESQQNTSRSVNSINSTDHIPITQSKLEYIDSPQQDKAKSSVSINSNKFQSRVKQHILSLQDPIRNVIELLQHINAANVHAIKRERLKDQFHKIMYVGGLSFLGHCNQFNQPCGFGKLLLNKDIVYQGQWRNGKFHGWGKLLLFPFKKYVQKSVIEVDGHFKCGMVEGSVICTFNNGQRFMGLIRNQSIEKQGTFVGQKGIMTGYWQNNRLIYLI